MRPSATALAAIAAKPFRVCGGAPVEFIKAAAREGEAPALPTFTMVAYNGGAMDVGWGLPVVIDLAGLSTAGFARPILKDHDPGRVVGHSVGIRKVEGRSLVIDGVVSGTGASASEVVANAGNGFPWQASVGVQARHYIYVKAGTTANANGQEFEGPLYMIRKGVLAESSFVALGADSSTSTSIAARHRNGDSMDTFENWLTARGFALAELTDAQKAPLQAQYDAEAAAHAPDDKPDVIASIGVERKAQAAESRRIAEIRKVCGGKHPELEAKAIEEGLDVRDVKIDVLRAERPAAPAGHVKGALSASGRRQVIAASLCLTAGLPEAAVAGDFDKATMDAAVSREWRGASLHALMHEVIVAAGGHAHMGRMGDDTIRAAFDADRRLQASGYDGVSLTNILGNVANKAMLSAFTAVNTTVSQFCHETDAVDFKTFTRLRLVDNGTFEKVSQTGELKHGTLSEESYTNKVDTRGRILTLTRQDIINDDLGAFAQLMQMLGRSGALAREKHVFEILLANAGTFFGTGNKNYASGADTALSIASFTALEQLMLDMKDSSGAPILVSPAVILVPTSLKVTAELLMSERLINETTTTDKGKPAQNPHAGKCKVVCSPYINAMSLAGGTSTGWFLFSNALDIPALQVAYLRGQRQPTIESGELDFKQLGISWRGIYDFGAKLLDPRGAVMSKGAA